MIIEKFALKELFIFTYKVKIVVGSSAKNTALKARTHSGQDVDTLQGNHTLAHSFDSVKYCNFIKPVITPDSGRWDGTSGGICQGMLVSALSSCGQAINKGSRIGFTWKHISCQSIAGLVGADTELAQFNMPPENYSIHYKHIIFI